MNAHSAISGYTILKAPEELHSPAVSIALRASIILLLFALPLPGQQAQPSSASTQDNSKELQVNWLYGAFVPKDVPLTSLTNSQRGKLYLRQTYIGWGPYLKTGFFAVSDQITNSPPEWDGVSGFGQRVASRFGTFSIQNTFSATGNLLLRYEPRYDRCRCSGVGLRVRHAVVRNFVTYNHTEHEYRPQIALYAGAMGAGMISSTWQPNTPAVWRVGYQSMITQAAFGSFANLFAEFAPEITGVLRIHKASK
jgi:hypothetical protein